MQLYLKSRQHTVMIRKNLLFIKMLNIKTSSKLLLEKYMDRFIPQTETCPICGAKGKCHIHAYYDRTITDYINSQKITHSVCIMRVMCDSCNHTHAILPDHIIPYGTHGLFLVLRVLTEYFFHFRSIASICEKYDISDKLFYKWRSLFLKHKKLWLGKLIDASTAPSDFMKKLISEPYSDFSPVFISQFSFSFMQSHKNPRVTFKNTAGYCQKVFKPDHNIL